MRASSPCGQERISAPQRGQGRPFAAVHLRVSGDAFEPAAHEAVRLFERGAQFGVGDVGEPAPRRDARPPERLGLPEVADTCDEILVEKRVADLALLVRALKRATMAVVVGRLGEDVGAEAAGDAAVELQHRAVEHRADVFVAAQHEPRLAEDRRVAAERPASVPSCAGGCAARARPRSGAGGSCRSPRRSPGGGRRVDGASCFTAARGCGVSTSSCWPTRTWRRCAAR